MKRLKNTHPGDVLKHEFLEAMHISAYRLRAIQSVKELGLAG